MTGTGTQNDPYIVYTWIEFSNAIITPDVYVKLGADLDLNEGTEIIQEYLRNSQSIFTLRCKAIDGDGHRLSNIYNSQSGQNGAYIFEAAYLSPGFEIKNLIFDNIILRGYRVMLFHGTVPSPGMYLTNCVFAGRLEQTGDYNGSGNSIYSFFSDDSTYIKFDRCTFSLEAFMKEVYPLFGTHEIVANSQIKLSLTCRRQRTELLQNGAMLQNAVMTNSYMTAEIKSEAPSADSNFLFSYGTFFSTFYFTAGFSNISNVSINGGFANTCFYDAERAGETAITNNASNSSYCHALTTAQCKDADYLRSIGYACEGGN